MFQSEVPNKLEIHTPHVLDVSFYVRCFLNLPQGYFRTQMEQPNSFEHGELC